MMKYCLVTGASGFVGRELTRQLANAGWRVRALVRNPGVTGTWHEAVMGELSPRPADYSRAVENVDTVFHLAAVAHRQAAEDDYRIYNHDATVALAQAASSAGVRCLVFASSSKAVAPPGPCRRDESWDPYPVGDPYGLWKRRAEDFLLAETAFEQLAILRPCLIYGPGQRGNLYRLMRAIDRGFFPRLPDTGGIRSMVGVPDVARALVMLATVPEAHRQVFLAADGEPYTAARIASAIRQALGKPGQGWPLPLAALQLAGRCGDALRHCWPQCPVSTQAVESLVGAAEFSADRLRGLGWQPSTTFMASLPAIVARYRETASC